MMQLMQYVHPKDSYLWLKTVNTFLYNQCRLLLNLSYAKRSIIQALMIYSLSS